MMGASLSLSAHESADDIRSRGDGLGLAGRDSTQPRRPVRPPLAWGVAGCRGDELPAGGRGAWRLAWDGGKLDSPLRAVGLWRLERSGRPRPTVSAEAGAVEAGGDSLEAQSGRLRIACAALGRSPLIEFPGEAVWSDPARPTMPAVVPAPRLSPAQTSPGYRPSKPAA